jgi:hypothetical protein
MYEGQWCNDCSRRLILLMACPMEYIRTTCSSFGIACIASKHHVVYDDDLRKCEAIDHDQQGARLG